MEKLPKINDKLTLFRINSTPSVTHYLITNVIRDPVNPMNSMITFRSNGNQGNQSNTATWETIQLNGFELVPELNLYDNAIVKEFIAANENNPDIKNISNAALEEKMTAANLVERVLNSSGYRSSLWGGEMPGLKLINDVNSFIIEQQIYSHIKIILTGKNGGSRRRRRKTHSRRSKKSRRYRRIRRR